jgi:hypothetical protein
VRKEYKYYVHKYINAKLISVETVPGVGEGRKGEQGRG